MAKYTNRKIIDIHAHIYPDKIAGKATTAISSAYNIPISGKGTTGDLLVSSRKAGVCKQVISSTATKPEQVKKINDFIASTCSQHPEFIGFGTLHPAIPDPEKEVQRILALGLKGIKIHPDFQKIEIDNPIMFPLYELLENKLPILFHIGDWRVDYSHPARLIRILKSFPNLTVIAAHLGAYSIWDKAADILVGQNVYLDTSSTLMFLPKEQSVSLIRSHGADRILFGSDYPSYYQSEEIKRFLSLGLTAEENNLILSENAKKLLNLTGDSTEKSTSSSADVNPYRRYIM